MAGKVSDWVQKRVEQISSLSKADGGGKNEQIIDSNEEFACIGRLLANCTENTDKKFIKTKMQEYLDNAKKEHFECENGTSYDQIIDETGNRMYVAYDKQGNLEHIEKTYLNEKGQEVSDKEGRIDIKS